jgi:hypothetical protein
MTLLVYGWSNRIKELKISKEEMEEDSKKVPTQSRVAMKGGQDNQKPYHHRGKPAVLKKKRSGK